MIVHAASGRASESVTFVGTAVGGKAGRGGVLQGGGRSGPGAVRPSAAVPIKERRLRRHRLLLACLLVDVKYGRIADDRELGRLLGREWQAEEAMLTGGRARRTREVAKRAVRQADGQEQDDVQDDAGAKGSGRMGPLSISGRFSEKVERQLTQGRTSSEQIWAVAPCDRLTRMAPLEWEAGRLKHCRSTAKRVRPARHPDKRVGWSRQTSGRPCWPRRTSGPRAAEKKGWSRFRQRKRPRQEASQTHLWC